MKVELTDDGRRISVDASFVAKDAVRAIPGSSYAGNEWTVPLTWAACLALRGTFGDDLEVGERLAAWSRAEYDSRVGPSLAVRQLTEPTPDMPVYDERLRPFQRVGVHWLMIAGDGAVLGDDLGAGKTVQLSVAIRERGLKTGVVVAPKSTLPAWKTHLEEWAGLRAVIVSGTAAKRREALAKVLAGEADVVVIAWETVRSHSRLAPYGGVSMTAEEAKPKELNELDLDFVILDEAHKGRDPRAKMTRAIWALGDAAKVRFAATGTPVGNSLDELWSVMRFVSPDEWPTKTKYVERYCTKTWNRWGGLEIGGANPQTAGELFGFLDPRYRAMPKDVVLRDLPPMIGGLSDPAGPQLRFAEMTAKQRKAFEQMREHSIADLDNGRLITTSALSRASRLLSLASAYGEVLERTEVDPESGLERVRQSLLLSEPSCKLDTLEELVTGELSAEPALIVFTVSRQLAKLAVARLEHVTKERVATIIGGQSVEERAEAIDSFQNGRAPFVVVTIAAGGTGITLTMARTAVFLQRDFSYINNYQAEGRYHRIGSEVHDRIITLDVVTPDTPDLYVLEQLREKRDLVATLTRFDELRALMSATDGVLG